MRGRDKVTALIIGRRKVGEADQLLTFFTRERGLLRVVAKGVRKIPSRRGGHLEPLTKVLALLGRHYVLAVENISIYPTLHRDPAAAQQVGDLSTLLCTVLPEGQPSSELFAVLDEAWQLLPTLAPAQRYILETTVRLQVLRVAGLSPALGRCLSCGRQRPVEAVVLRGEDGGWQCLSCYGRWAGSQHSLSPTVLKALRWLHRHPEHALRLKSNQEEAEQLVVAARHYSQAVAYG